MTNSWGLALAGMQITDDNGGFPILGNSLIPGVTLPLGASGETAKPFAGAGTYTVPAGKWFWLTNYAHAAVAVADTITPSGGAALTIASSATFASARVSIFLGPGDAITLGNAGSYFSGTLFNAPSGAAAPTRILQTVSNTVTLAVPALRRLLLTAAIGASGLAFQIDGTNAGWATQLDAGGVGSTNVVQPLLLGAGQVIASSGATLVLISGLQFTTAT